MRPTKERRFSQLFRNVKHSDRTSKITVMNKDLPVLDDVIAVLERTPATLMALLDGLPEVWVTATEGEGTWSPFDVVGHL